MTKLEKWQQILKTKFGFDAFRPGQLVALTAISEERRVLCILPTGRGKSLLYQFPSLLLPGVTLVISPLLALMRDQVNQLKTRFQIEAASINSDQHMAENEHIRTLVKEGNLKILFVSPEQLDHVEKFQFLCDLPISLVVIDEAHCISTWGHDFRPSYRQIIKLLKALEPKNPRILGLTATADRNCEVDIQKQINATKVIRESLDRPNLKLSCIKAHSLGEKLSLVSQLMTEGTTLIYCATRENCELVAEHLTKKKIKAIAYHAGLEPENKIAIQQAFLNDEYQAIAATNALGMGIDKPNIRTIIHFDIPGSITAYYQEVGRAGRDNLPAAGFLLYDWKDTKIQEYFITSAMPEKQDFENVLATDNLSMTEIKQKTGLHPTRVQLIIAELVEQGFFAKEMRGKTQIYKRQNNLSHPDLSRYDHQLQVKTAELKKMIRYAELENGCRMKTLRLHLGDIASSVCNHCDLCKPQNTNCCTNESAEIDSWIQQKPIVIPAMKLSRINEGLALFDGKQRNPLFVQFMKERKTRVTLDPEILELCKKNLQPGAFAAIVPVPSTTWLGRKNAAQALADYLKIPLLDILYWKEIPLKRQGELLNNDQRAANVNQKMAAKGSLPEGPILLFDDYIGSGATLREASRAIREIIKKPILIPFTIASVKWKLGSIGFI
ncbi:MAG TPA: RecQ family ATP-dependent DNA helicase [Chlamydiales bacterium]|nr:RecQ family ATP-dependent DNA helicase [Chlamydiales bacterium]